MAKPEARIQLLQALFLLGGLAIAGKAASLQLFSKPELARKAATQGFVHRKIEAERGVIYDRSETPLAVSLERYRLDVSFTQLLKSLEKEPKKIQQFVRLYNRDIGMKQGEFRKKMASSGDFYLHGPLTAGQVQAIRGFKGVRLQPLYRREYPSGSLARPLIGALAPDSASGRSGLERFLDSLLSGVPGEAVLLKDAQGRTYESPGRVARPPTRGHDVVLTIDRELQEIAEGSLTAVFSETRPRRGDIIFLDPSTGEVLAAASREVDSRGRDIGSASYFQGQFEPGSTAKLFTAAALLALGRVDSTDTVSPGEDGVWMTSSGRPVRDVHAEHAPLTLAKTIQISSNIGIAKFAQRLTPSEHYEMLRAFGFGMPTGIEFPGEAAGTLPKPIGWQADQQPVSLAMGYAMSVTPVQLAAAYAAIANDGVLLAPAIIKEVRSPSGKVVYRHTPKVVRRVVSSQVAKRLREFLALSASDSGTGQRAQVRGKVLGKTGTSRLIENGRYGPDHAALFAGIYPAENPQLAVVVRIEAPEGQYYGGEVAAPLVARMLTRALAAQNTDAFDRSAIADQRVSRPKVSTAGEAATRPVGTTSSVKLPLRRTPDSVGKGGEIPDLIGENARAAIAALHRQGYRVKLEGNGVLVRRTQPSAGESLKPGSAVTLYLEEIPE